MPASRTRRVWTVMAQLPELLARVRQLESQVQELAADDPGPKSDQSST
jgi:hypothetical protein